MRSESSTKTLGEMGSDTFHIQLLRREEYDAAAVTFRLPMFLASAWIEALAGPGRRPAYFDFRCGRERVGIAAGLEVSSPWRIFSGVSKHLYLYGLPPIEPEVEVEVMERFRALLRQQGFNALELAYYYNTPPPRVARLGFRPRLAVEYRLDLEPTLTELYRGLNRTRRNLINRAKKNELLYDESQSAARLGDLLTCLQGTKQRRTEKGVGSYSYYCIPGLAEAAVRRLLECGLARLCTVSRQGRLMSAALVIRTPHQAYYVLAGATAEGYSVDASTYMLWCVIERSKAADCITLNLAGVPKDESSARLVEFKRSFGAKAHTCEAGSCYLLEPWRKCLYRCYKFASSPQYYVRLAAHALRASGLGLRQRDTSGSAERHKAS